VRPIRFIVKYWLPVLVWMVFIFGFSSDKMSFQHSSRIIGPLVHWMFPDLSSETINSIVFVARKCAHVTEYALLALLVWRAVRKPAKADQRQWKGSEARLSLVVVALYACTDELHQAFVPSRQGSVWDVLLDTSGAALGLLLLWAFGRWRRRW
jgi:VanZ family protein